MRAALRHAHHVRDDDESERDGGKCRAVHVLEKIGRAAHRREGVEPLVLDGEEEHQEIGDEEFGRGDRRERYRVDDPVIPAVAVERRHHAEEQRQRHSDDGGHQRKEESVVEPGRDDFRHTALDRAAEARIGVTEVAHDDAADPFEVAHRRRTVHADFAIERCDSFRGCALAENGFSEATGQQFKGREDHDRHRKECQQSQSQALQNGFKNRMHASPHRPLVGPVVSLTVAERCHRATSKIIGTGLRARQSGPRHVVSL